MQGQFIWYELMTADPSAAADFYRSVVGWDARNAGMDGDYQVFEVPGAGRGVGGLMAIPAELSAAGIPPNWTGYVSVDDVDAMAQSFKAHGGSVRREPMDIPGVGRFAVVSDPQGAVLIVFKPAPMDVPPPEATMTPGFCGWHELYAGDGPSAFEFYARVFGWTLSDTMDMGPMGVYQIFAVNGQMAGGIMTKAADMPIPFWSYYFIVDGIDTAAGKVKAGGGSILNGPMEVPGGFIIQCLDPQGAYVCFTGPRG